ncbi:hypothetical protein A2630_02400 [Candidatus Woesebacteria bacterium RIFCSPHIGHO2_01_FULL_44_10]|nr:MAG: hypothetical protein A2630_02400 [Candidatus Woesebacteria bacterium RIFCSPHIGHO2_01_FULL_44_10]OGM53981.1 MAG: hypothetical protein A3F62_00225 [Candidatus Woesebacteria bacterium RIFCSPHIGHO2_12_FULL_44_11]
MTKVLKKLQIPREYVFVGIIAVLGFLLRVAYLNKFLFFGFEQGRDFFALQAMSNGDIRLMGPFSDVPGVMHGAAYFYLLLPLFLIFNGNPYLMTLPLIFVNCLSVLFLYLALKDYFNKRVALVACLLYLFSYSAIVYSRWLSNPVLIPAALNLLLFFLVRARKDWRFLLGVTAVWGVIFHFLAPVAISLIIPIVVFVIFEKIKLYPKRLVALAAVLVAMMSTYILFDLTHNFVFSRGLLGKIATTSGIRADRLSFVNEFTNEVVDNLFPSQRGGALVLFAGIVGAAFASGLKNKRALIILGFLFFGGLTYSLIGFGILRHFYITFPIFLAILAGVTVDWLGKRNLKLAAGVLILVLLMANLWQYRRNVLNNLPTFIYHAQRTYLQDMKDLIDFMYADAAGGEISYNYYTVPYWQFEGWLYLFETYALPKYGYLPQEKRADGMYTLMEPNETIPVHRDNWYGEFKKGLDLVWSRQFGHLTLEKWEYAGNF